VLDEALRGFAAMRARRARRSSSTSSSGSGPAAGRWTRGRPGAGRRPAYREQLLKRLRDAGLELDVDDERVLREIALFADRCDITEEITRFRSHTDQLRRSSSPTARSDARQTSSSRRLGREANTIGSKANDLAISKSVIELKNELERIREQMRERRMRGYAADLGALASRRRRARPRRRSPSRRTLKVGYT